VATSSEEFHESTQRALRMIADGNAVGLGTGHAATAFILALGERVQQGLTVRAIATSQESENLARQLRIPITTFDDTEILDITVDGADEVDPRGNLIKGYGGALVREKIVAAASRRLVILVGPEKLVPVLGSHGKLPVEVVPFGLPTCLKRLTDLGYAAHPRLHDGRIFVTDNGNYILDCHVSRLDRPDEVEQAIRALPGVVGTGLFLSMAASVIIQNEQTAEERHFHNDL